MKKYDPKQKTLPPGVKAIVYGGNISGGPGPTIQFGIDLGLYGLREALLYVRSYEDQGYYRKGTGKAALELCGFKS